MSAAENITAPFEPDGAKRLMDQFAVCQAAELARSNNYDSAESLLKDLVARPDAPTTALDLQARIFAQQGRMAEAEVLWRRALEREPANAAYQAGLARITRTQRRPVWFQTVWPLMVGVVVLLCGVVALSWQARRQSTANARLQQGVAELVKAESQKAQQQMQVLLAEAQALNGSPASLARSQKQAEATLTKLGDIDGKLDGWASAQDAVSGQLKVLQADFGQLAVRQGAMAEFFSHRVDALQRSFEQGFSSTKDGLAMQVGLLQADGKKLADEQQTAVQTISNQMAALRLAMDRDRALVAEIEQRRVAAEKLQTDYRTLATNHERLLAQAGMMTNPPMLSIELPGVRTGIAGRSVILVFEDGLFDHGSHFKLGANERLTAAIKALAQSKKQLTIEVIGYSDGDQGFFGPPESYSLGLKRATTVVNFIRLSTLFSPSHLRASSGGSAQLPFSSDTELDRSRNRTVVLKISRDEKRQ